MRPLGFSTGSLCRGNFEQAIQLLRPHRLEAIELSALREDELEPLLRAIGRLDLCSYQYVSLHAPSRLRTLTESELVAHLLPVAAAEWHIIVHPDIIHDFPLWATMGSALCIENMDKRKAVGRSAEELAYLFQQLPQAKLCLDVGHSRQVDPSMLETWQILKIHGHRLAEIHLSEVNCASEHEPLNRLAIRAFQRIAPLIPDEIPIILESPVQTNRIANEVRHARQALPSRALISA